MRTISTLIVATASLSLFGEGAQMLRGSLGKDKQGKDHQIAIVAPEKPDEAMASTFVDEGQLVHVQQGKELVANQDEQDEQGMFAQIKTWLQKVGEAIYSGTIENFRASYYFFFTYPYQTWSKEKNEDKGKKWNAAVQKALAKAAEKEGDGKYMCKSFIYITIQKMHGVWTRDAMREGNTGDPVRMEAVEAWRANACSGISHSAVQNVCVGKSYEPGYTAFHEKICPQGFFDSSSSCCR